MKRLCLAIVTMVAVRDAVALVAQSSDPWIGTWTVNLEKSTYRPGPKPAFAATTTVTGSQDSIEIAIDNVNGQGRPTHEETTGRFDGKQYPVKGAPNANTTMGYRRIDSRTFESTVQVNGTTVATYTVRISADGQTWTATQTGTNAQGQATNNVVVLEKQPTSRR